MRNSPVASLRFGLLPAMLLLIASGEARAQDAFSLPDARAGQAYEYHLTAEGGLPPLAWRVVRGELPSGIVLDSAAGVLRGKPETPRAGAYVFTIEVNDSSAPPQAYSQAFSLAVLGRPLRIVLGSTPLKIVPTNNRQSHPEPPAAQVTARPAEPTTLAPVSAEAKSLPVSQETAVPLPLYSLSQAMAGLAPLYSPDGRSPSDKKDERREHADHGAPSPSSYSPSAFVCLYEDTPAGDRYWMYRPNEQTVCMPQNSKPIKDDFVSQGATRLLSADENSTIVIVLDRHALGQNIPFNKVFMTAQLGFGDQQKNLEIEGYSKIGVAKDDTAAQRGMAFESVRNVQAKVARMADIAEDILRTVLNVPPYLPLDLNSGDNIDAEDKLRKQLESDTLSTDDSVKHLIENLRLHRQEISDISDYLTSSENRPITQLIAVDVLHMDSGFLQSAATEVKADLTTAFDSKSTQPAVNKALLALWDRNVRLFQDFAPIHARIAQLETKGIVAPNIPDVLKSSAKGNALDAAFTAAGPNQENCLDAARLKAMTPQGRQNCIALRATALDIVAAELGMSATKQLKRLFAEGSFSLRANAAKAGNIITLTVQAMGTNGATVGIPSVWEIEVKQFGLKHAITDSFLFLYRLGLSSKDTMVPPGTPGMTLPAGTTAPVKAINFAPSPGVTLGLTYYKRGTSGWDKFWRGLGPGVGVNVSFMNFNDPGFDLSTGTFTNTTGTNIQVGAGVIYSLLGDSIQFTNGWNLNVDRKRAYFGVGFSFVDFTKKVAAIVKK